MDISTRISSSTEAAKRPLGNTAKSSSPQQQEEHRRKARAKRAQRYQALSQARSILWAVSGKVLGSDSDKSPGDLYRTIDCRWARRAADVEVHFAAVHQAAHYGKLATCASVWACPVCCSLIQERRRPELAQLVTWAYNQGKAPVMVTLTFPHTKFDSLADLLSKQREAFRQFRAGKAWQSFKQRHGFVGLVRSLELTHGRNGWHPHTHELWIVDCMKPSERALFLEFVRDRWFKVCAKVGLVDASDPVASRHFLARSVDVRFQVNDSDYLAKLDSARAWGVDAELAKSSSKAGKASGVHPHEFLTRRAPGDADLYLEYVNAMKGERQLYWSARLKDLVGIKDMSNEEIVEQQTEKAELLGLLTSEQWRNVRGNDARAELLDAAELGGWPAVLSLLRSLGCELSAHDLNQLRQVYGV